jgi:hypothetical protein
VIADAIGFKPLSAISPIKELNLCNLALALGGLANKEKPVRQETRAYYVPHTDYSYGCSPILSVKRQKHTMFHIQITATVVPQYVVIIIERSSAY